MPGKHWVIVYNTLTFEYRKMRLFEEWLPFKYCATEDIQPAWEEKGLYDDEESADNAYVELMP